MLYNVKEKETHKQKERERGKRPCYVSFLVAPSEASSEERTVAETTSN